jgi:hypothetical protein
MIKKSGLDSRQGQEISPLVTASSSGFHPASYAMDTGGPPWNVKGPGLKADYQSPSSQFKYALTSTSTPLYISMAG